MTNRQSLSPNQKAYDLWASQYDHGPNSTVTVDEANFPAYWKHLREKQVLEVGCGTGRHTQKLVAAVNFVTGIEPSAGMLAVAREKLGASEKLTLIEGDFLTSSELDGAQFDAIVTSLVLEHIGDLTAFFSRVNEVLKPGGEFFLSEIHPKRIAAGSQAHFTDPATGAVVRTESYAHDEAAIESAGYAAGLQVVKKDTIFGTKDLAALHPGWEKYEGRPMIQIWVWRK